ncbi:MAG: cation transporter [Pseudomonadota bacterium]
MIRTLSLFSALSLVLAAPAWAQNHDDHDKEHQEHKHGDDHKHDHKHEGETIDAAALTLEVRAAVAAGGDLVVADVLGVVCDFCATAMNKTFGKRKEVAAVYVDLDRKTLNLAFKPEMSLDDATIEKLVKRAGYKVKTIRRDVAVEDALDAEADDAPDRS